MEKEGTVRSTFANLRNLNRHQNKKHIQDAKVRKCPFGGCEIFSFRMEHLASHLHMSHGKTETKAKVTDRRTPEEVRKRSEMNSRKKWIDPIKKIIDINNCEIFLENLLEISVNVNEQNTIHVWFWSRLFRWISTQLRRGVTTQRKKADESQLSQIPLAVEEEDGHWPCVTEMEESQPQEPRVIETTITLNLVTWPYWPHTR